jgi:hypothetical protein
MPHQHNQLESQAEVKMQLLPVMPAAVSAAAALGQVRLLLLLLLTGDCDFCCCRC